MAVALRPAVLLIILASLLFFAAGTLDASSGAIDPAAIESWVFGAVNLVVAILIARGNERTLALRIGLAAFFMVERPVTAVAFDAKPVEGIALHMATAILEAVILVSTLRVWRLGHSVSQADLALFALQGTAALGTGPANDVFAPIAASRGPALRGSASKATRRKAPKPEPSADAAPRSTWAFALIGALALILSLALIGDAVVRGIVPGTTVDLASPEWLGYVFALVVLIVASRAVHQRHFAVRLLLVVSLIVFVERAFTPFALSGLDAASLALHAAGALAALALALTCAAALRAPRPAGERTALPE